MQGFRAAVWNSDTNTWKIVHKRWIPENIWIIECELLFFFYWTGKFLWAWKHCKLYELYSHYPSFNPFIISLPASQYYSEATFYCEILNYHPLISSQFYQGHILPCGSEEAMTRFNMALMKVTYDFQWS